MKILIDRRGIIRGVMVPEKTLMRSDDERMRDIFHDLYRIEGRFFLRSEGNGWVRWGVWWIKISKKEAKSLLNAENEEDFSRMAGLLSEGLFYL